MAKTNKAKTSKNAPARSTKYHSKVASKASAKKASAKTASAKKSTKTKVDPITLSVIRGILETTQREMTLSLEKTARSSVFNLAHDYSTALFNHVPEMILQGQDIPIHLGSIILAMKPVARHFGDDLARALFRPRHSPSRFDPADRPGLRRQSCYRRVQVQAGLLHGQVALLD